MYNFFVKNEQINENNIKIFGNDYNHIKNVLRLKPKETIQICDIETGMAYLCEITNLEQDYVLCSIIKDIPSNESKVKTTIFQGIPKAGKMENIIQKSVELGAYSIVPVKMEYCIGKVSNEDKKIKRWQAIAEAASKQSKRTIIPEVHLPINMKTLYSEIKQYDLVLVAYENEKGITIKDELINKQDIESIAVIIGPEGGLSKKEVDELVQCGAKSVSLGKRILRTETASTTILSIIMYEFEL